MACVECGRDLGQAASTGRPRRYCSRSCQSRAYRRRRDEGRLAVPPPSPGGRGHGFEHGGEYDGGRGDLVRIAIGLADDGGARAVTLRAVAHQAGLPVAEVRRAFGSRDGLVAALVQRLLTRRRASRSVAPVPSPAPISQSAAPVPPPSALAPAQPTAETPVQTLTRLAEDEWAAYREHPWLVSVLASSRPPLVPAVLDSARASTEAFAALGADPPSALGRYLALSGYVQGMALLLLAERDESRSGTAYRAWWSEEVRRLDRTGARRRHPWLDAVSDAMPPTSFAADADTWFRDGLDRVLAGLTGEPRMSANR